MTVSRPHQAAAAATARRLFKGHGVVLQTVVLFFAVLFLSRFALAQNELLKPDAAFRLSVRMADPGTVEVHYDIANGYYMYRDAFRFSAQNARIGTPIMPPGDVKFDETFRKNVETYRGSLVIRLPVTVQGPFKLSVTSRGCADAGICYMPTTTAVSLGAPVDSERGKTADSSVPPDAGMGSIERSLKSGQLLAIVPLFLLLGLGLAFTPCVLPMVPILSSIIIGGGARGERRHGLRLSVAYALGMALVYTLLGVAAGLAGQGLAASLQNVWVLGGFAGLMAVLALPMFGVFELQMPAAIQTRLSAASGRCTPGKLAGVFVMGGISALVVGPCVAAPLAGALIYISETRDVVIGGAALFAMSIGMSVPLLLVGASAGALVPRAGPWMDHVKRFFGVLMLATALWIAAPVIPAGMQMFAWAVLGLGYAAYLLLRRRRSWLAAAVGVLFMAFGALELAGLASGGDAVWPLAYLSHAPAPLKFTAAKSLDELDAAITAARGKPVMLDFYADWCISCKEMEARTLSDPQVQKALANFVLVRADVTANRPDDVALLKRFRLFGPPGIVFFNRSGHENQAIRVIGFQNAGQFMRVLKAAAAS